MNERKPDAGTQAFAPGLTDEARIRARLDELGLVAKTHINTINRLRTIRGDLSLRNVRGLTNADIQAIRSDLDIATLEKILDAALDAVAAFDDTTGQKNNPQAWAAAEKVGQ